jgi:hypothetical protein
VQEKENDEDRTPEVVRKEQLTHWIYIARSGKVICINVTSILMGHLKH